MDYEITTEEGVKISVKRLVVEDFAKILKQVKSLPEKIVDINTESTDQLIASLPGIIADFLPELSEILAACTNTTAEEIRKLDLSELTELTYLSLTVNKYDRIMDFLGKIKSVTRREKVVAEESK